MTRLFIYYGIHRDLTNFPYRGLGAACFAGGQFAAVEVVVSRFVRNLHRRKAVKLREQLAVMSGLSGLSLIYFPRRAL